MCIRKIESSWDWIQLFGSSNVAYVVNSRASCCRVTLHTLLTVGKSQVADSGPLCGVWVQITPQSFFRLFHYKCDAVSIHGNWTDAKTDRPLESLFRSMSALGASISTTAPGSYVVYSDYLMAESEDLSINGMWFLSEWVSERNVEWLFLALFSAM